MEKEQNWCSAASGSHLKDFSSDQKANRNLMHMAAYQLVLTVACVPTHSSTHSNCVKLISYVTPLRSQRNLPSHRDDRHAWDWFRVLLLITLCRRLNCVEIQLSGSLCSLQDWGGDDGRGGSAVVRKDGKLWWNAVWLLRYSEFQKEKPFAQNAWKQWFT